MALLTHATTTQKDQGIMNTPRVITGADHPTTDMAATLHHIMAATHTMGMGLHPTFEWCLGHSVSSAEQYVCHVRFTVY